VRSHSANRVRIIGGIWRGSVVPFPQSAGLRPTPDRVRETLFNWLGQHLDGQHCLELYAGSGVLSLEAISRGAMLAVAVDRDRQSIAALRGSAARLGTTALEAHTGEARSYLAAERRCYDLIFLDPPFADDPWDWLLPACAAHLNPRGYIYAEARREIAPSAPLQTWRRDKAGQVHYHLFALPEAAGTADAR
jgi:16S rRNA (guanine966-N2)-methyltransferase